MLEGGVEDAQGGRAEVGVWQRSAEQRFSTAAKMQKILDSLGSIVSPSIINFRTARQATRCSSSPPSLFSGIADALFLLLDPFCSSPLVSSQQPVTVVG